MFCIQSPIFLPMATDDEPPTDSSEASAGYQRLYVEFELRSVDSVDCPLEGFDDEVTSTSQQSAGGDCHTDTTVDRADPGDKTDTEVVHTKTEITGDCHCPVFFDFDCIPTVAEVADDYVVVQTYLSDRELLTELVGELKTVTETLSLRRLMRVEAVDDERTERVTLDLSTLTELEQETAMIAVGAGYYQQPRETTLKELADRLEISKSALSRRLSAIESKLAIGAFASDGHTR